MFDVLGRIDELRNARHLSVYKLAQLSGIPQSTIATWYQKSLYPPIDKLEIICGTFHISLSEFFRIGNQINLNQEQLILISRWNLLTEKQQKTMMILIDTFLD